MRGKYTTILIFIILNFTITVNSQDTILIQPGPGQGKDALLHGLYYLNNNNFGDDPQICANAWTFGGEFGIVRSIFEFDLSSIPENAIIYNAYLSLYACNPSSGMGQHSTLSGSNACWIKRVTSDWDEMSVTWNTKPNTTDDNQISLKETNNPNQNYLNIDVTQLILDMIDDPLNSHGFMIKLKTEEYYRRMNFASSDHENRELHPKLKIIICAPTISNFYYEILNDDTVNFFDSSIYAHSWHWDFGDGSTSDLKNPIHKYNKNGTYHVCLTTANPCSSNTYCDDVIVCRKSIAKFTYQEDNAIVNFYDTSLYTNSWHWDFGDGAYSDLKNPIHQYQRSGTYYVCLNTENSCSSDLFCDSVSVCIKSIANYTYKTDSTTINFSDLSENTDFWFWDFSDGYSSYLQNPVYDFQDTGTYIICLSTKNSCSTDIYCDTVNIKNIDDGLMKIKIYPNPTKGILYISNPFNSIIKFQIFSIIGGKIYEKQINFTENKIQNLNLSKLENGSYIIKITDKTSTLREILILIN